MKTMQVEVSVPVTTVYDCMSLLRKVVAHGTEQAQLLHAYETLTRCLHLHSRTATAEVDAH